MKYDYIILGSGIFGLYSASLLKDYKVAIIEIDDSSFSRASFINQARVHNGYHYPRSPETALKSIHYFNRFSKDFDFAINKEFKQIYSIAKENSLTNAQQFIDFCKLVNIPCKQIYPEYIKDSVEASFETMEYSFDAKIIKDYLMANNKADIYYSTKIEKVEGEYTLYTNKGIFKTDEIINTTYASINQMSELFNLEKFNIKYEICEVIMCDVPDKFKYLGVTIMDGPFCSIMPFGLTGKHTLTSVTYTPHKTSFEQLPTFDCQNDDCTKYNLDNCSLCKNRPKTAFKEMNDTLMRYVDIDVKYIDSYFAIKPILTDTEKTDARPTVIKRLDPHFLSVLSGKISTIYDLSNVIIQK
jgi:hypothetical protein